MKQAVPPETEGRLFLRKSEKMAGAPGTATKGGKDAGRVGNGCERREGWRARRERLRKGDRMAGASGMAAKEVEDGGRAGNGCRRAGEARANRSLSEISGNFFRRSHIIVEIMGACAPGAGRENDGEAAPVVPPGHGKESGSAVSDDAYDSDGKDSLRISVAGLPVTKN